MKGCFRRPVSSWYNRRLCQSGRTINKSVLCDLKFGIDMHRQRTPLASLSEMLPSVHLLKFSLGDDEFVISTKFAALDTCWKIKCSLPLLSRRPLASSMSIQVRVGVQVANQRGLVSSTTSPPPPEGGLYRGMMSTKPFQNIKAANGRRGPSPGPQPGRGRCHSRDCSRWIVSRSSL